MKFVDSTSINDDGYPLHKRKDDGKTIQKVHVSLNNRFIVPYNAKLFICDQAHINVESCNQGA